MSTLKFINVNKIYNNHFHAVHDFNLDVSDKEFIVFVGPSGCGKSTTLRMIAGLEQISSGEIYIDDKLINDEAPKNRNIAMVFQSYALYPHMSVFENMAFSLKLRKDKFPVLDLDTSNPEYIKEMEEIEERIEKETNEGIDLINNSSEEITKKVKVERIKDLKYRQEKKRRSLINSLYEKYSVQVLDYDHELVKKLNNELKEVKKANPVDEIACNNIEKEIERALANKNVPQFVERHYTSEEIAKKVFETADTLGLEQYLKRKPVALSGGQRQRVALGRAIVRNPKVFLMDEPLSNLDAKLRVQMRSEIIKIHKRVGATTIYVTHDQTEAMTMATRIVCMKDGYIQQIGTPKELYNTPNNMFVAGFIGAPAMNFVYGTFDGKSFIDKHNKVAINLDKDHISSLKDYINKEIVLGVRPEDIYLAEDKKGANISNPFELTCDISELLGKELMVYSYIEDQKVIVKVLSRDDITSGDKNKYVLDLSNVHFFDPNTTERI